MRERKARQRAVSLVDVSTEYGIEWPAGSNNGGGDREGCVGLWAGGSRVSRCCVNSRG